MGQYITAGLIGSLVTIIIQAIINAISESKKHKRSLATMVFQRKIEVVEKGNPLYTKILTFALVFILAGMIVAIL